VKEALDRAAAKIGERFQKQPLVEAAIRTVIGNAYSSLHAQQQALSHLEHAVALHQEHLGPHHSETLASMEGLANVYSLVSRHSNAIDLRQRILDSREATLGPDHAETLACLGGLASAYGNAGQWDTSVRLFEQLLDKQRTTSGTTHPSTFGAMHALAINYFLVDRFDESIALHVKVLDFRKSMLVRGDRSTTGCMMSFAQACQRAGKLDQADQLLREALQQLRKSQDSMGGLNARANALGWLGRNLLSGAVRRGRVAIARSYRRQSNRNVQTILLDEPAGGRPPQTEKKRRGRDTNIAGL